MKLEALVRTAIGTGARQGELLGLTWRDVDLERGTITIRHALQRRQIVATKTEKSRRTVDLPEPDTLRRHKLRQAEALLSIGKRQTEADFVFGDVTGEPLDGTTVTKRFQAIASRAGLSRIRFHDLRHLTATILLERGVPPRVVMEVLGHSTITLMNLYSHVIPALRREAADELALALAESV